MEDQTVSGQEKVGQEEDNKEEEDDYNPGIKAGSGARKNICENMLYFSVFGVLKLMTV